MTVTCPSGHETNIESGETCRRCTSLDSIAVQDVLAGTRRWALVVGDNLATLRAMPDNSVDSVVTDPPYGLANFSSEVVANVMREWLTGNRGAIPSGKGFMGKSWDAFVPPPACWDEVIRVLKPGGHLVAASAPRTYDLMAMSIRLAGFEVRDQIDWIFHNGFPKSSNLSKGFDKRRHDREEVLEVTAWIRGARDAAGITNQAIDDAFGFVGMSGHWTTAASQPAVPTLEQVPQLLKVLKTDEATLPPRIAHLLVKLNKRKGQPGEAWETAEVIGDHGPVPQAVVSNLLMGSRYSEIKAPNSDLAKAWEGWGTALKPSHEPFVLARKPPSGTVLDNAAEYGVGGLHIDACRIPMSEGDAETIRTMGGFGKADYKGGAPKSSFSMIAPKNNIDAQPNDKGRFPANVILSHADECGDSCVSQCAVAEFDRQSGESRPQQYVGSGGGMEPADDFGGASRFYYVAKPDRSQRDRGCDSLELRSASVMTGRKEGSAGLDNPRAGTAPSGGARNFHPTVKPWDLMGYLCRLVTPPGGVILEPFAGSFSTGVAAMQDGFRIIGCELSQEYAEIALARIADAEARVYEPEKVADVHALPGQLKLFGG